MNCSTDNDTLKKRASIIAITVAISLCLLKVFASYYTGSLSILSSMIDSLSDIIGSLVTLIAVRYSCRPACQTYRYGYGKAEALSALFQAVFIACSGLYVICDGINRFYNPIPIEQTTAGLAVMIFSLIATFALIAYQRHIYNITRSQAILADSAHYVTDILTNSSIIITLLAVKLFDWIWFDTIAAIIIAAYLLYNAYTLAKDAVSNLLDRELDNDIRTEIKKIVTKFDFVKGIHDLRTRDIGGNYFFEFHLEMDGNLSLKTAHEHTHQVENAICKHYPNSQIIIHQEPAGIQDDRLDDKLTRKNRKK